jgi:hypothetical protein
MTKRHPGATPVPIQPEAEVEVDESRERLGEGRETMRLESPDGVDDVGEEMGEAFVENVTGADDAATEHRSDDTPADEGGPFVITTGATEFASGTDGSNPADAEPAPLPTV